MPTTSSTTSAERSPDSRRALPLVLWLALAALQIAVSFAVQADGSGGDGEPLYSYSLGVGSLVLYGILVALTLGIARLDLNPRAALGLRRFPPRTLWLVVGIVLVSIVVSAVLEPVLHAGEEQGLEPERWDPGKTAPFVFNAAIIVTVVPFAEELFYRGLGVHVLRLLGAAVSVAGTAVIFGLAHGILVALPALGLFGALLAWLRLRAGSVWPAVIAHAVYNGLGIAAFFVTSAP